MKGRLRILYPLTRCFVFTLVVAAPLMANAGLIEGVELIEERVKRYNGPANVSDYARAIAVDESGNIYVTGASEGSGSGEDYATVKYDTNGNELWVKQYNGPGNDRDFAYAIAVDESGNVYVTGESEGSGSGEDYATVKYDTDGNELWVARYNGPTSGWDGASAIAVDALGNVYVTGSSQGSGTSHDYATVKYDTDGNELWVARYNGPGNDRDAASAIAVDALGNVYVTGDSQGIRTDFDYGDYATVKYDTDGNELWVARYNGPTSGWDGAEAIAVDASGNVYVTGWSVGSGTGDDYATVKYDTDGNERWVKRYNGPEEGDDEAYAIIIDAFENVYVTGNSFGNGTSWDYTTVKYDTDGNERWVRRYNGPGTGDDYARALAVDSSGNVYVTGASWDIGTGHDYATVKYDTNGNELWVRQYNGLANRWDYANALFVDASGNVYVIGSSWSDGTGDDYATVKYDPSGNELWVARYTGLGGGQDRANAIAVDSKENFYVTGSSKGIGTGFDYATVKYDTDGHELWVARYNGPGNGDDYANAIAVDTADNVYVTGRSKGIGTGFDYATVKYDPDGNELWVSRYNGPGNGDDVALAIAVDTSAKNVSVTGKSSGISTGFDYATVKYDTDGNAFWDFGDGEVAARYNGPGNDYDGAYAIAVDSSGNIHVTGASYGSGTSIDYATVKYDSKGRAFWKARYNGPINGSDEAFAIAVDSARNVYVTGASDGGTGKDYATVKYGISGDKQWVARYNGPGNGDDYAQSIAIDSARNVYVTGASDGSGTGKDYATMQYGTSGDKQWVARYNGPGNSDDEANAIAVDSTGNIYVTGWSKGIGTGKDYATVKYATNGKERWVQRYNGPGNGDDYASAMAVDSSENVYVTGVSEGSGTSTDYATMVKYRCRRCNLPTLPTHFDWRDHITLPPIRHQGACGACWAFSAVGAVEGAYIVQHQPITPIKLSEQNIVSDCGCPGGGCYGGYPHKALEYIQDHGIVDERCFPYQSLWCFHWKEEEEEKYCVPSCQCGSICSSPCACDRCGDWDQRLWKIEGFKKVSSNIEDIKRALICFGPLSVTSDAWAHGVVLVGYDDDAFRIYDCDGDGQEKAYTGFWTIRNSHGISWGFGGYGIIPYTGCKFSDIKKGVHRVCGDVVRVGSPSF